MLVGLAIMEVCINIMTPFPPPEDDDGASTLAMFKVLRLLRIARIAQRLRLRVQLAFVRVHVRRLMGQDATPERRGMLDVIIDRFALRRRSG